MHEKIRKKSCSTLEPTEFIRVEFQEYHEVGITLNYNKHQMWLTHYPFEIGLRPRKWSIHGHIHSKESSWDDQINVGVDSPHFKHKPFGELITIDELYDVMRERLPEIEERYLNQKLNR